jgi:hypothetical protein
LAGRLIKEAHELTDTPLGDVFPLLGPCSSGKKGGPIGDEYDDEKHEGMTKE